MVAKRINPAALYALTTALSRAFWYKKDLRAFLHASISDRALVADLDWSAVKRQIASQLVDSLAADQDRHLKTLLNLIFDLCDFTDPTHLRELEDGEGKYRAAVEALDTLRKHAAPYRAVQTQEEEAFRRRQLERARMEQRRAIASELDTLNRQFFVIARQDPQTRGYRLEKLLNDLFVLYDIDARAPFRIQGEQIDGAFTLEGTEFILEAKWQQAPTPPIDLDSFARKVERKLDNTLGLFVSMSGFTTNAVELHSLGHRPSIILMTGEDLAAVLDDRIALPNLIVRKRQHASSTGEILLTASRIIS
ncbi:MAG: restriction endonuclease [Thermomicrobiales bacterium]